MYEVKKESTRTGKDMKLNIYWAVRDNNTQVCESKWQTEVEAIDRANILNQED